ncbi:hypothetical protein [Dactylosporangium sp. NPDC048998]|uniref:hypothetical protein n=1 Tax=Dactylosporangium sp. NPDC048998 TaxID=3363976 RepID=UPI00371DDD29
MPHSDALKLVVWLARHTERGHRPHDLAPDAFGDGLPIPFATARAAWRAALQRVVVPRRAALARPGRASERGEWAWDVAEHAAAGSGTATTVIPRRMRGIDERIAAYGWSAH